MYQVLMEAQRNIDINSFSNKVFLEETEKLETQMTIILKKNRISTSNVFFNTRKRHVHLDIVLKVKKFDYIWKDNNGNIIAYWDHGSKNLIY